MNEMKPEDVMRALTWYEVVGKNVGNVTMPYYELKAIADILREKDSTIAGYILQIAEMQKQIAIQDRILTDFMKRKEIEADKDAEIERLKHSKGVAQVNIIDEIANRMRIKEFNSNEIDTGYAWAINDLLKLLLELKKKVMRGDKDVQP